MPAAPASAGSSPRGTPPDPGSYRFPKGSRRGAVVVVVDELDLRNPNVVVVDDDVEDVVVGGGAVVVVVDSSGGSVVVVVGGTADGSGAFG